MKILKLFLAFLLFSAHCAYGVTANEYLAGSWLCESLGIKAEFFYDAAKKTLTMGALGFQAEVPYAVKDVQGNMIRLIVTQPGGEIEEDALTVESKNKFTMIKIGATPPVPMICRRKQ